MLIGLSRCRYTLLSQWSFCFKVCLTKWIVLSVNTSKMIFKRIWISSCVFCPLNARKRPFEYLNFLSYSNVLKSNKIFRVLPSRWNCLHIGKLFFSHEFQTKMSFSTFQAIIHIAACHWSRSFPKNMVFGFLYDFIFKTLNCSFIGE